MTSHSDWFGIDLSLNLNQNIFVIVVAILFLTKSKQLLFPQNIKLAED